MEFCLAPEIRDGLAATLRTTILGYTSPTTAYFDAICSWLQRRQNLHVDPSWIVPTHGVVTGIGLALKACTQPGDGIIVMTPVYYPFFEVIKSTGRTLLEMELTNTGGKYSIDFEILDELASTSRAKALLLCSPHNPVGRVWTQTELQEIGRICKKHNLHVISDEIHADLIMPGFKHTPFLNACPDLKATTISLTAPSKTFNLAGMQAASAIIPNEELRGLFLQAERKTGLVELPSLSYMTTILAYTQCDNWYSAMITTVDMNRQFCEAWLASEIPQVKCTPLEGTYLLWFDLRFLGLDPKELEKAMINADLFFDEGYIFGNGGAGFERMNLATPLSVLQFALVRLRDAVTAIEAQ